MPFNPGGVKLFNYWRSSSSWRVRLALAYKKLPYEYVAVALNLGAQHAPEHKARNATAMVPVLEVAEAGQTALLTQSVAIAEYLEEAHPTPSLFPPGRFERAHVRALAEVINSGIQPFQNLATLNYVKDVVKADQKAWAGYWISKGLTELQSMVAPKAGRFMVGDQFTWADCCLLPQMYAARRFGVDSTAFETLHRIEQHVLGLDFVKATTPDAQPDAQPS